MVVGTVLVTVGLLLILSDLGALVAGPTSKNIRLELQIFQFQIMGIIVSTTELYILLGIVALDPGAAPDPDADLVRSRRARGDAGPGGRAAVRGARGRHSRRDRRLRLGHRRGRRRALHPELPDQSL